MMSGKINPFQGIVFTAMMLSMLLAACNPVFIASPAGSVRYQPADELLDTAPTHNTTTVNAPNRASDDLPVIGIAHGIASSPIWSLMPGAALLVRTTPPLIAVVGHFDDASEARLEALSFQAQFALRTLRYVNYSRAEEGCRILAALLLERFGEEGLKKCHFTVIPRGGYFIL